MKLIIIEDEKPAAEKLSKAIGQCMPGAAILAILDSVQASVEWLQKNPMPELIFMDIELSDGLSFRIFENCDITCPVIFVTAYDEYWQEAFEHNSIDYLLKPVRAEKLSAALKKYNRLQQHFASNIQKLMQWRGAPVPGKIRERFLVKRGSAYIAVKTSDIAYFYATHKLVCLVNTGNQKFMLDDSLADLEATLNAAEFYRVNRKWLVNVNAIQKIIACPKGKLSLQLMPSAPEEIIVSSENATAFKQWIGS